MPIAITHDYETPKEYFNELNEEFNFTLDPCCTIENAKCDKFYTKDDDGLLQDWSNDIVFMNPPFGTSIKFWIEKAYKESILGAIVVCLIPARTDTKYWHKYIFPYAEIRFMKGRLKYRRGDINNYAPFPIATVIFGKDNING